MTLLRLTHEDSLFTIRVAAACFHDGHVLLNGQGDGDFWLLPGGHGEFHESTDATVRRELREELGVDVEVGRLLWVVENFFTYEGVRSHQISFVYEAYLPSDSELLDTTRDIHGFDGDVAFIGRWIPIASLPDTWLLPSFLCAALQSLPDTPQHIVHVDAEHERDARQANEDDRGA